MTYREVSPEEQIRALQEQVEELRREVQALKEKAINSKWEYTWGPGRVIQELGKEGWELFMQDSADDYIFKRRIS